MNEKYIYKNWKKLCQKHARIIMICPCYIVEKNECDECKKDLDRLEINNHE